MAEQLADFGVIKIETVKKYLRPTGRERERNDRERQVKFKSKGVSLNKKNEKDERMGNAVGVQNRLINP